MDRDWDKEYKEYHKSYYQKNKEKQILAAKNYYKNNKEKHKNTNIEYIKNNKEKVKEQRYKSHLMKTYNITKEYYNELFEKQNGCCSICGIHQSELKKRLFVDHDHNTGKIRGLLCHNCNVGIGFFNNNEILLLKAMKYLSTKNEYNIDYDSQ